MCCSYQSVFFDQEKTWPISERDGQHNFLIKKRRPFKLDYFRSTGRKKKKMIKIIKTSHSDRGGETLGK